MEPLTGKVAIVTGASSGLGRAAAVALSNAGAHVIATARRIERLQDLEQQTGCRIYAGDAAEEATATACVEMALTHYGRVDILINNAGAGLYRSLVETSAEDFDELVGANLRSGFVFSRAVAPHMIQQRSGQIVFVSSVAGVQGAANESVYAATKFAQVGMAQSLDAELRQHNIKVAAFCPGGMKTEFAIGRGRTEEQVSQSRMMAPEEVAETLLHLCSLPPNVRIPHSIVRHMG